MKKTIAVAVMILAAIGATTGTAAAATTPNGFTGACNMMRGTPGMATAMTTISEGGMRGMMGAHTASGGTCS